MLTDENSLRVDLAQNNDELIDALVPNAYKAAHLKKAWHARTRAEIDAKVAKEVEATMTLVGLRQQAQGIDVNVLLASASNDDAVNRLAGFMTQEQIKQMQSLLDAVGKKMKEQPERASAQRGAELDDDMNAILAGGSPKDKAPVAAVPEDGADEDTPMAKRQKMSSDTAAVDEEEL